MKIACAKSLNAFSGTFPALLYGSGNSMPFTLRRARRRDPTSARSLVDVVKATIRAPQ